MTVIEAKLKLRVWRARHLFHDSYRPADSSSEATILRGIVTKVLDGFLDTMDNNQQVPRSVDEALSLLFQDVKLPTRNHEDQKESEH